MNAKRGTKPSAERVLEEPKKWVLFRVDGVLRGNRSWGGWVPYYGVPEHHESINGDSPEHANYRTCGTMADINMKAADETYRKNLFQCLKTPSMSAFR